MNEEEAARLLENLGSRVPVGPVPANEVLMTGKRNRRRRTTFQVVGVSAAVALVSVGGFAIAPTLSSTDTPLSPVTTTDPPELRVSPGSRLVGMNEIAVEIPQDWGTNDMRPAKCDGEPVPVANTVVFGVEAGFSLTPCMLPQRWSSLHVVSVDDSAVAEALPDYEEAGDVDGVPVFRSLVRPRMCGKSCLPTQFNGALIVPSQNVLMFVHSPQRSIIEEILGSVRLIPEGYTAVPDLTGRYDDSEVSPIVREAGLVWQNRCPEGADCDIGPIEATDPAAGSVVPVGTTVTAVGAPNDNGTPVHASEAVIAGEALRAHLTTLFEYHKSDISKIWVNETFCAREPVVNRDNGCRLWTAAEQEELKGRLSSLGAVSFVPTRAGLQPPPGAAYASAAHVSEQSDTSYSVHVFAHDGDHAWWGNAGERPCGWQVWTLVPKGSNWTATLNEPVRSC